MEKNKSVETISEMFNDFEIIQEETLFTESTISREFVQKSSEKLDVSTDFLMLMDESSLNSIDELQENCYLKLKRNDNNSVKEIKIKNNDHHTKTNIKLTSSSCVSVHSFFQNHENSENDTDYNIEETENDWENFCEEPKQQQSRLILKNEPDTFNVNKEEYEISNV